MRPIVSGAANLGGAGGRVCAFAAAVPESEPTDGGGSASAIVAGGNCVARATVRAQLHIARTAVARTVARATIAMTVAIPVSDYIIFF